MKNEYGKIGERKLISPKRDSILLPFKFADRLTIEELFQLGAMGVHGSGGNIEFDPTRYDHMIKNYDKDPVHRVVSELNSEGLDVYLTGGVVDSYLFGNKKDYGDVDIFAMGKKDTDTILWRGREKLFLEGRPFIFEKEPIPGDYNGGPIHNRLKLLPEKTLADKLMMRSPSVIDISIYDSRWDEKTPGQIEYDKKRLAKHHQEMDEAIKKGNFNFPPSEN